MADQQIEPTQAGATAPAPAPHTITGIPATSAAPPAPPAAAPQATPQAAPAGAPAAAPRPARQPLQLTQAELNDRLERTRRKALMDVFGTDDTTTIKAQIAEAQQLKAKQEEAERARMTTEQRLQADLKRARDEAARYRTEVAMSQEREIVREQQGVVEGIARRFIDPKYLKDASFLFARFLRDEVPAERLAKWTERDIAGWFRDFAKRRPAFAGAAPARPVDRQPAGAATPPAHPTGAANASTTPTAKGFAPSSQNPMGRQEARQEARKLGYTW